MQPRRFRVSDVDTPVIPITGAEARHALRVLRLCVGDRVVLFDGDGQEVDGKIRSVAADSLAAEAIGPVRRVLRPGRSLTLAVATPKGQRADWLVEKCAELGVRALWLLQTERGVVNPGDGKIARWRRKAAAAAKQAGQARVMAIEPPRPIQALITAVKTGVVILYGEPDPQAPPLIDVLNEPARSSTEAGEWLIFIGPEGGFTNEEREQFSEHGGRPVRLARSTLRIETAAIAAAAVWAALPDGPSRDAPTV